MKKLFSLMLLLATMISFTACGDDEPNGNLLVGTEWIAHAKTGSGTWILEFSNSNTVVCHCADDNGRITSANTCTGTYLLDGSSVTFSHVEFYWSTLYKWIFNNATLSKNRLTVTFTEHGEKGTVVFDRYQ